ncbi:hypothetical protein Hdeb2414_s0003g00105911 [Helianthus debilis subsp. tardiflorus]
MVINTDWHRRHYRSSSIYCCLSSLMKQPADSNQIRPLQGHTHT